MARQKRNLRALDKAEKRLSGLRSISETLDLGSGLTIDTYQQAIDTLRTKIAAHNETLSHLDRTTNEILEAETTLRDISERMLMGIAAHYGKDSHEYEMAGGTRRSERKRPARRSPAA